MQNFIPTTPCRFSEDLAKAVLGLMEKTKTMNSYDEIPEAIYELSIFSGMS